MSETKSSDILLSLDSHNLEVWKAINDVICVRYVDSHVKDGPVLIGTFGRYYYSENHVIYLKNAATRMYHIDKRPDGADAILTYIDENPLCRHEEEDDDE